MIINEKFLKSILADTEVVSQRDFNLAKKEAEEKAQEKEKGKESVEDKMKHLEEEKKEMDLGKKIKGTFEEEDEDDE